MQQLSILFVITFAAAFFASLPPGLLNMNAAKTGVKKGKNNGIIFGFGVAFTVMVQAYLSVRIAKYLSRHPEVIETLLQVACVIFAFLAIFFFRKARKQASEPNDFVTAKKRNSFSKGAFLASINLLAIPYYSGLNTLFHGQGLMFYEVIDEVIFIMAAGGGTFLAMYLYVFYFDKMEQKTNKFSKKSDYILSALMVVLLVITFVRLFN